ncbi:MAG: SDR family NAD(P)-dependent oxidoreductase [Candidatus Sulfotelmatobacter sp.]
MGYVYWTRTCPQRGSHVRQENSNRRGASQGIGAGFVEAFRDEGYNVVATSRTVGPTLTAVPSLVLVDGDIAKQETAAKIVEAAIKHLGTIDVLLTNAEIFRTKAFTEFTTEDFNALVSINRWDSFTLFSSQ